MNRLLIIAAVAFCALADPVRADERQNLVATIVQAQIGAYEARTGSVVEGLAVSMGADRANLTTEERALLEAGLSRTLTQAVGELITPVLSDHKRYSIEDLRAISAFVSSPAGEKYASIAQGIDMSSPALKAKIVSALLRNVDPNVLAKLVSAPDGPRGRRDN